ncbi:MAG: hypothetical protein AB7U83_17600 [Vicinamibacterales bacterium]
MTARLPLLLAAAAMLPALLAAGQPAREQIALGATTAQRNEAARLLVPLLKDVRRRADDRWQVSPGTVPDSPFAGTQTTLFAVTLGQRSVPVDPRVVAAMDRLIGWEIDDPAAAETGALFDRWLGALMERNTGAALVQGRGPCDLGCMTRRMTTLDESWGSPRTRGEARDEVLLDALTQVVTK